MPPNNSKRRFTRLAVKFPLQIETEQGPVAAGLLDLSRGGVRLKVAGSALGVYRLAPMGLVGRRVAEVLGAEFSAQFNPDRLGSLLTRRMRPVRIGQRSAASADVELGCVLVPPLTDEEAGMLGLSLPVLAGDGTEGADVLQAEAPVVRGAAGVAPRPLDAPPEPLPRPGMQVAVAPPHAPLRRSGTSATPQPEPVPTQATPTPSVPVLKRTGTTTVPPAVRPAAALVPPVPAPAGARRSTERGVWRAYVHPSGSKSTEPFVATTEAVSPKGVEVRVLSFQGAAVDGSGGVAATASRLGDVLGSDVALRLVDGATHLWTGPARIEMVEVGPAAPHPVNLWLAFGRPLRPAELRMLGLE